METNFQNQYEARALRVAFPVVSIAYVSFFADLKPMKQLSAASKVGEFPKITKRAFARHTFASLRKTACPEWFASVFKQNVNQVR